MNLDVIEAVKTIHEFFLSKVFSVFTLIYYGNLQHRFKYSEYESSFYLCIKNHFLHEVPQLLICKSYANLNLFFFVNLEFISLKVLEFSHPMKQKKKKILKSY